MVASAGHKLGQVIGDWWEEFVLVPTLSDVAEKLDLFLDHRFRDRPIRESKIIWSDSEGNKVDYDFVLELGGTIGKLGVPVGAVECCWRSGSRHSKDKARDDTNKLLPMRSTYPTCRFLAMAWAGELTEPARDYARSRNIEVFWIPKEKVIKALEQVGIDISYTDSMQEKGKNALMREVQKKFKGSVKVAAAEALKKQMGPQFFNNFSTAIEHALSAVPQSITLTASIKSLRKTFADSRQATAFLERDQVWQYPDQAPNSYEYEVVYSDGSDFILEVSSIEGVREVHDNVVALETHMNSVAAKKNTKQT